MFLMTKHCFSSNPLLIYKAPVDVVLDAYNYYRFMDDYQSEFRELNKKA